MKLTYPTSAEIDYISAAYYTRLKAEAFDPDGQIAEVRFYGKGTRLSGSESVLLGVATNVPFSVVWWATSPPDAGVFWSFYAIARDNLGAETRSQGVLQYVEREGLAHVTLSPADGALVASGSNFELSVELVALDLPGRSVPVGMYFDGEGYARTFPPITNANPTVSVVITNITEGEHIIYSTFYPRVTHRVNAVKLGLREPLLTWDGNLEFELVTAFPGRETVIESSTNLVEWAAFRTVTPETNYVRITVAPEDGKRWFRARVEEGGR